MTKDLKQRIDILEQRHQTFFHKGPDYYGTDNSRPDTTEVQYEIL